MKVPKLPGARGIAPLLTVGVVGGLGYMDLTVVSTMSMEGIGPLCSIVLLGSQTRFNYPEGTHLVIPWYERPFIYDVRAKPYVVESNAAGRDLQMVLVELRVLTRSVQDELSTVYRTLGENYVERVLPSIIHETLKAVVARYNASQLITRTEAVSREMRKILTEKAANFNIALNDVSITNLTFGKEFLNAIEAKQVAAQEAERAKFVVEKAEQDKKSAFIRAEGEATSAKLISQVITNNPRRLSL